MPVMPAPSQSQIEEFKRRRKMIEYTLCYDEDIWNEMEQEENKTKPVLAASPQLETRINTFLLDIFQNRWYYNQEELDLAKKNLKPEMISPANIAWSQRRQDVDDSKSGQYTLNPETQNLDFERAKVFIPNYNALKSMEKRPLSVLGQHIQNIYGSKYHIPGIEYWQYILQNPDKAPSVLKDNKNCYFYFGSILRHKIGYWYMPYSLWDGSSFSYSALWLTENWYSDCRVVLLEK